MCRGPLPRPGRSPSRMGHMTDVLSSDDPRPAVALARDYAPGVLVAAHAHNRAQLLYGISGTTVVTTVSGSWMMPPDRALWIPACQVHEVRMIGAVRMRNLYLRSEIVMGMPPCCTVLAVTDLVRVLLTEATALPEPPAPASTASRDIALMALLALELPRLASVALNVPLPPSPRLRALCEAFLLRPGTNATIDDWCRALNASRRSFTRRFRAETGLSFGAWRQQARVLSAVPRLLGGEPVTAVALDLGYENPAAFATMFRRMTGDRPSHYTTIGDAQAQT